MSSVCCREFIHIIGLSTGRLKGLSLLIVLEYSITKVRGFCNCGILCFIELCWCLFWFCLRCIMNLLIVA